MKLRALWTLLFGLLVAPAAGAQALGEAVITARLTTEAAEATVALDRATTRFAFAPDGSVDRNADLELTTPGLTLKDGVVTAPQPFQRFDLRIRPMAAERDAKYPAHYRVGEGGVIYAPALRADPAAWRTRMVFRPSPGQLRLPQTGDVSRGFVYLGPPSLVAEREGVTLVVAPGTPAWLVERTGTDLAAATEAFTASLKARLSRPPLLVLKHSPQGEGMVADVTAGGVVAIRFHGDSWRTPDPGQGRRVQSLVLHEAFHLWNGDTTGPADGTPAWLHEGGAEYASLLSGMSAGVLDEAEVRSRLGQALTRCRGGLQREGDKALTDLAFLSSNVRYPCGMVLQWTADLHLSRATAGGRGVLDAWADTVRLASSRRPREYRVTDFYAASGLNPERLPRAMSLLLSERGPERWAELPAALSALGARIDLAPTAEDQLGAVVFHLLSQHCPEGVSRGFYTEPGRIRLDSKTCGVFASEPTVNRIEGAPIFEEAAAMFAAVERKCAAGGEVVLSGPDGVSVAAPCRKPLPPAPKSYVVTSWRSGEGVRSGSARPGS